MRICPICKLSPRAHDACGRLSVPENPFGVEAGEYIGVCTTCIAKFDPSVIDMTPFPTVARNIVGTFDESTRIFNSHYCGVCLNYAREDDPMGMIELLPEDLSDLSDIEPGKRICCTPCAEYYKPRLLARWIREGIVPENTPISAMNNTRLC